jgi:hypothetical protein
MSHDYDLRLALEMAHTLGRIKAVLEMASDPKLWRMTPEKAVATIREILTEHDAKIAEVSK